MIGRDVAHCSRQPSSGSPTTHDDTNGGDTYRPDPRIGHTASGDIFPVDFDPTRNYLRELKNERGGGS